MMPNLDLPERASELLNQADVAFLTGHWSKGSSFLWSAYADTIESIAVQHSLPCDNDDDIRQVLRQIAIPELDYYSLVTGFSTASRFRNVDEEKGPKDYEVEFLYPEVRFIVAELAALA